MAEFRSILSWRKIEVPISIASHYRVQLVNLLSVSVCLLFFSPFSGSNQVPGFCTYGELECGSSSSKLLIKGGTIVNAHHQEVADVYVEDGMIVSVQPNIHVGDDVTVLDATGKYVMPGGIDPHTHLEMEFMGTETIDDFFSGQAAALAGGTTMHIDFVIPVDGSLTAGFEAYTKKAGKSCMDYGFHMAITKWDEVVAREMEIMVREKGINSFKFFLAYKGSLMISDELLLQGFKKCKSLGALAMVHAENGDAVAEGQKRMIDLGIAGPEGHALSRPPVLEGEATARAIRLAGFVNTPLYVVHVMSIDAMEEVGDDVKVIDATGKYVMPGGIDPHTHLETNFIVSDTVDDFFSGQAGALAGGTTMNINFVLPVDGSLSAGFEEFAEKAKKSCMDYGFHMAITKWNEVVAKEMEIMVEEKGINSFKFFLAYKEALMINDELLLQGLKKCKSLGALPMVHAENGDAIAEAQQMMIDLGITGPEGHALSRPAVLEGEATGRAIRLAAFVNTPIYVVHVMSIDAMEEIAKARAAGQRVIGEPIAAGLALDESGIFDPSFTIAAKNLMSPPIRKAGHDKALQAALSTGILQLVGTDHCSFNSTQKALGIDDFRNVPNGVNGIEERMHLVWDIMVESGLITPPDFVRITSTECAKIFNIYPRKGAILAGSDADIIILNPNASFEISAATHHTRSDTNVFEGKSGKGKVEVTIAGGRVVWEGGELKVVPGSGRYIEMPPFSYLFNGIDKADAAYLSSLGAPVQRFKATT